MAQTGSEQSIDQQQTKMENVQSVYQSYIQYPTGHMPSQQSQQPTPNQPKLSNKNPVMHLNELRRGIVFDITKVESETTEEGSTESTQADGDVVMKPTTADGKEKKKKQQVTYTCTIKVDDEVFSGAAKSQKLAKVEAAKYALLKKFNILYVPGYDNVGSDCNIFGAKRKNPENQNGASQPKKKKNTNIAKNALMVLNEKKPGLSYNLISQTGAVHAPTFVIAVEVEGQTFTGTGTSKKAARLDAAQNACNSLNFQYTA